MRVNIETQYACVKNENLRGINLYTVNLVKSLSQRNRNEYSITFFDQNKERGNLNYILNYIGLEALQNIQIYECNKISYRTLHLDEDIIYRTESYNSITGIDSDIFHFPHYKPIPYKLNGKLVVTIHDLTPILPKAKYWFTEKFLKDSSRHLEESLRYLEKHPEHLIITDSIASKNDILSYSGIPEERIFVIPLAHDCVEVDSAESQFIIKSMKIDGPYLLYLGELDFRKGVVDILDAFKIVKQNFPEIKLVLAGLLRPSTTTIHEKLHNCQYIDDVYLPGYVTNEQKQALLSEAAIFLFPSEYEGFGLPVLEAMACGTPVITSNISSLPEVGGDAVIYVTPKHAEMLAFEIENLLSSDSLRNNLIKKGLNQASTFSWDKTAKLTEDVYKIAYNIS